MKWIKQLQKTAHGALYWFVNCAFIPPVSLYTESVARRYSIKKVFLIIFTKFTGKRLCQSLFFNKVAGCSSFLKSDSHLSKKIILFALVIAFPKWWKYFLFHLKSSFRFQDIETFTLSFWTWRKTAWLER